ncbi:MAG: Tm-1-like ATP-binding domain-containing protein [Opitutus sp.]
MSENRFTPCVYAVATMDTKAVEILYVAERMRAVGTHVTVVNVGTGGTGEHGADVGRETVAMCHPQGREAVFGRPDRGQAIAAMSVALTAFVTREHAAGKLAAIIGIGGGGGTSLITRAMRALPIGVPKLMVSTLASGNVAHYIDCSDITMMPSVVDVAGINRISRQVLANAAHAIAGMAQHRMLEGSLSERSNRTETVALTMFGVTTPCVDAVRKILEVSGKDCLVFHATGTGGRTMEKLVESGLIDAVLDITTTEVSDEVVGGVLSAGPERFDRIIASGVPYVMSLGAIDMVNYGGIDTVPEKFRHRNLHVHNSEVTLMRTTTEENRRIARWIAAKVNQSSSSLLILIPERGLSMLDAPGQPFYDPEADAALFTELERAVHQNSNRQIRRVPCHINEPAFSEAIVQAYREHTSRS